MFDSPCLRYTSGQGGWRGGRGKQQVDGSCSDAAIRSLDCSRSGGEWGWQVHPADPSQVSPFLLTPQSPGMDPKPGHLGGWRHLRIPTRVLAFFNWRGGGSPATPTRATACWSPLRQEASTGKKREQATTSQTVGTPFESLSDQQWQRVISPGMRRRGTFRSASTTNSLITFWLWPAFSLIEQYMICLQNVLSLHPIIVNFNIFFTIIWTVIFIHVTLCV